MRSWIITAACAGFLAGIAFGAATMSARNDSMQRSLERSQEQAGPDYVCVAEINKENEYGYEIICRAKP